VRKVLRDVEYEMRKRREKKAKRALFDPWCFSVFVYGNRVWEAASPVLCYFP
jgi:hypothetical protein